MNRKIYLLIAVVFLLGMLSGGLLVTQIVQSRMRTLTANSTRDLYDLMLKRMDSKLDLTHTQMERISVIFEGAAKEIEPLRSELRAKLLELTRSNNMKIQDELDPKQRERYQHMVNSIIEKLPLEEPPT